MRSESDDTSDLQPHERLREIAAILAQGAHRLRLRPAQTAESGQDLPESSQTGLEVSATSCPDGPVVNGGERTENGYANGC
jgi:hypothetical protein